MSPFYEAALGRLCERIGVTRDTLLAHMGYRPETRFSDEGIADALLAQFGLCLSKLAWVEFGDFKQLPEHIRPATYDLHRAWSADIDYVIGRIKTMLEGGAA